MDFLNGRPFRQSSRLKFASSEVANAYREAVKVHLHDHPFLRDRHPVNDVLGSYVLAFGVAEGFDLIGGEAPGLLAAYGRQPFLWRFFRRLAAQESIVGGDHLSHLMGSYWSGDLGVIAGKSAATELDEVAIVTVGAAEEALSFQVLPPIALRREVRNFSVDLPSHEVVIGNGQDSSTRSMKFVGDV
jgi:hypothetical protein